MAPHSDEKWSSAAVLPRASPACHAGVVTGSLADEAKMAAPPSHALGTTVSETVEFLATPQGNKRNAGCTFIPGVTNTGKKWLQRKVTLLHNSS